MGGFRAPGGDIPGTPLYHDEIVNRGYAQPARRTIPGVGTRVQFNNGQYGFYDVNGNRVNQEQFGRLMVSQGERNARQGGFPRPMMVPPSLRDAPKDGLGVARTIQRGAQDASDWLQYGTEPGFHLDPTDAERASWHNRWIRQQEDPRLAEAGNRVAGDVPTLIAAPGEAAAMASQYSGNAQRAAREDLLASTTKDPRVAARYRAAAAQLRAQNQQIGGMVKEGVGLGPNGLLTRGARAFGYEVGGQPRMAHREISAAAHETMQYGKQHPLLFLANAIPVADGAFALSKAGLEALTTIGASGVDRLATKAFSDANLATDAATKNSLLDAVGKYKQIAEQMRQGKPVNAVRIYAGPHTNASLMPDKAPAIVRPLEIDPSVTMARTTGEVDKTPPIDRKSNMASLEASAKAGASSVSRAPASTGAADGWGYETGSKTWSTKAQQPSLGSLLGYPFDGSSAPSSSSPSPDLSASSPSIGASADVASSISGAPSSTGGRVVGAGSKTWGPKVQQPTLSSLLGLPWDGSSASVNSARSPTEMSPAVASTGGSANAGDSGVYGSSWNDSDPLELYHYSPVAPENFEGSGLQGTQWLTNAGDLNPIAAKKILTRGAGFQNRGLNGDYRYTVKVPNDPSFPVNWEDEMVPGTHSYIAPNGTPQGSVTGVSRFDYPSDQWVPLKEDSEP